MINEYRYFLESNFAGVNRLFALAYTNQDVISKRYKTRRHYLPKGQTLSMEKANNKLEN